MDSDLHSLYQQIAVLGRRCGADKVLLYGSRARGDARPRSDIDLAVYGLGREAQLRFAEGIEGLPTLLDFDLIFVTGDTDPALLHNIEKDGVSLMGKLEEKYSKLVTAVSRLEEGVAEYRETDSNTVRDGVIQRFEFCAELAWKTAREYLLDQGYTELNSPKAVMRRAYADGLISDDTLWLSLLNDRNLTSHIYDETTAAEVFSRITADYVPLFHALIGAMEE